MRIYTEISTALGMLRSALAARMAERRIARALRAWLRPRNRKSLRVANALAILLQFSAVLAWAR